MKKSLSAVVALLTLSVAGVRAQPIALEGTEGLPVVVAEGGLDVVATYLGTTGSYSNDLYLGDTLIFNSLSTPVGARFNLGKFAAGTELVFKLLANGGSAGTFYSGDPVRNPDLLPHARVEANWGAAGVTLVSFEDLVGLPEGAGGFNDLSFSFSNTTTVPEPASYVLTLSGLLALAGAGHRRRGSSVG